jgi:HYR domain
LAAPRVLITSCILAPIVAAFAGGGAAGTSGTLDMRAEVRFLSVPAVCPSGAPDSVICHARTGTAIVAGLGRVTETYTFLADPTGCGAETYRVLSYPIRLSIAGKGDLNLVVAEIPGCIPAQNVPGASPQTFTVMGGSGAYVGASGSGTLTRVAGPPGPSVSGTDTWTGTITVPELEFDLTAPTISGARSKAISAPRKAVRVRVRYAVRATDDVDGAVPVACLPPSGSRFTIGRTVVRCSATDASGNTATASFRITVKRRR